MARPRQAARPRPTARPRPPSGPPTDRSAPSPPPWPPSPPWPPPHCPGPRTPARPHVSARPLAAVRPADPPSTPRPHRPPPAPPGPPRPSDPGVRRGCHAMGGGIWRLCRTAKLWVGFCTHTAHDEGPVRGDSLSGVISAIVRGGIVASALRPVCADHLRDRAADADRRGRDGVSRSPGTPYTPRTQRTRRAASHPGVVSRMADIPPLISPCGIASEQTGDPGPWRRAAGEETVLPSTSRNGARQEPEDNADQAGRSQGRAAREGGPGR